MDQRSHRTEKDGEISELMCILHAQDTVLIPISKNQCLYTSWEHTKLN